jgi:1,4-dihydroxy-2-naphthoate octaprenyltransferase
VGITGMHLSANTLNDYFDWQGTDRKNSWASPLNGGSRFFLKTGFNKKIFLLLFFAFIILACLSLLYFISRGLFFAIPLALLGALLGIFYSLLPVSLQSRGWGELAVFLCFGPLITLGTAYVLLESLNFLYIILGIPFGFHALIVVLINQIPDYNADIKAGKKTLIVRLKPRRAFLLVCAIGLLYLMSLVILYIQGILGYSIIPIISVGFLYFFYAVFIFIGC